MKRTFWHNDATPVENTLDRVMYEIKFDDTEGLLLDSVSLTDIIEDSDGLMAFDALITPYARLPARMDVIKRVMIRAGTTVQPLNVQTSEPFMQNGTANVAAIFELSDGQTISIFFHNPDTTPKKILPTDELISWKWLLNKKDITIVVAPEKGLDLNPRQVAVRIMKLAEKNSASFIRSNGKRAERMQALEDLKTEITGLEGDLKGALHRLEIAKVEKEDRDMAAAEPVKPVEKNKVTLVWSEASEAENKEFSTLNELQQFMREEYGNDVSKVTDIVYDKHKVIINGEASRIDVGVTEGDFNPFKDNLSKYLIADGFDVEIEPDLPSLEPETADPEVIEPIVEPEVIEPVVEPIVEPVVEGDQEILNGFSVKETIDELNRDYSTDNDVWNAEPSEIQALSEESYNKLSGALENANYHPENATFKAKRSGIEPVIDPELTATEEETNEQTNEQTEVETETEAAGTESGLIDRGNISDDDHITRAVNNANRMRLTGKERRESILEDIADSFGMTKDEVAELPNVKKALASRLSKQAGLKDLNIDVAEHNPVEGGDTVNQAEIEKELEDLKLLVGTGNAFDEKIDALIEKILEADLMPQYEPQLLELDRDNSNANVKAAGL